MTDKPIEVTIENFHPLTITWPDGELVGEVRLVFPPIHVKMYDLSMGDIIPGGPHLGSDAPIVGCTLTFDKPADKGDFMKFIEASRDDLETAWQAYQDEFDKKGALLG